jgi:prepilin-type N-terminal cleavage/methylation domain-containing protein
MTKLTKRRGVSGFTLIEVLVVIGLIAILAAVVIIAINPGRQFAQARNAQRTSNVAAVLNAIGQRLTDNKGIFSGNGCPDIGSLTASTTYNIYSSNVATSTGSVDLSCLTPAYIPALPTDPSATGDDTGYDLMRDSNNRYTVSAPSAELGESISITR